MIRLSPDAASAAADAVTALLDGGTLQLYAGPHPEDASLGVRPVLIAEARFGRPAFLPAEEGNALATSIAAVSALASGLVSFFQAYSVSGELVLEGEAGREGDPDADLILSELQVPRDAEILIERLIYRHPTEEPVA